MGDAEPAALWRAEVPITTRNSYDLGRLDIRTRQLDQVLRDDPSWPGRSWLLFTGHPGEANSRGYPETHMAQYVYCGKRHVKAERITA